MKHKYPLLLLFSVVILFSLLGSFTNNEGFEDMPIPTCPAKECSNDDYILKSQIVPPVCPACPPYIASNSDDKNENLIDSKDNNTVDNTVDNGSIINKNKESQTNQKNMNYSFKQTIETKDNSNKENSGLEGTNPLNRLFNNKLSTNETNISEYKNEIEKLKEQLKQLKTLDGNCPPCPACERCPEPSFDCKKVPNYRSTSVGDYLPIPILNDFSRFS